MPTQTRRPEPHRRKDFGSTIALMEWHRLPEFAANTIRLVFIASWLAAILFCLTAYLLDPGAFSPQNIASYLSRFHGEIWFVYILISAFRGFTLLPSTPLVIAGTILFPDQPFAVLTVSIAGILLSSMMIYFFSDRLGFRRFFEKRSADRMKSIRLRLEGRSGVAFVALWSFFPLVPTDLVCYVAGTAKMNFVKFILAIFAGELVLCSFYIFFGNLVIEGLR